MEEKKRYKVYKIIMLIVLVAFITFMITSIGLYQYFVKGDSLNKHLLLSASTESKDIANSLDKYKAILNKYYLGEINEEKLKEGAIKGYIEEMQEYMEDTKGNFVGIGIYMIQDKKTDKIMIVAPIKNSPAEKAGVQAGDLILAVDGQECTANDMNTISSKIKGEAGTIVKLKLQRGNDTLELEIKRESVTVNPVESKMLESNIGYIKFTSFDENTSEDFKKNFETLQKKGAKSLIIDLRNNGGGIVGEALKIADYITEKDSVLLYEVDKENKEVVKKSEKTPIINMPVILLTNENTASSSEILAGALKDLGKAKIVGTKTYGKGVIQEILTLPDGSGIKITTEKYLTPNKTEINKVGIEPDEKVELPEDLENVLEIEEKDDTQLQKAIQMLK